MKKKWVAFCSLLSIFFIVGFSSGDVAKGYSSNMIPNGTYSITLPGHHSTQPSPGFSTRVLEVNRNNELVASNFYGSSNQKFTFVFDCYMRAYKIYNNAYCGNYLLTSKYLPGRSSLAVVGEFENPYNINSIDYYWYVEQVPSGNYLIRNVKNPSLVIDLIGNNPFLDTRFQLIRQQPLNSVHTTAQQVNFSRLY